MAEEEEQEDGEETDAGEEKSGPDIKKLALFAGLPALIVVLGLVAGALFLFGGSDEDALAEADGAEAGETAPAPRQAAVYTYEFDGPIVVQFFGNDGTPYFLTLNVRMELSDPALAAVLDERMPRVLDQFTAFLRELTPDDLAGSAGLHRVRLELLRRTNLAIAPDRVEAVLLDEVYYSPA